jgi:photosystem II stability/assembly factor-like uncharacterized protein
MNIKLKHFGILSILLLLVTSVFLNTQKPKHSVAPQDNHPGWFKQFIKLKGDENGKIPHGLTMKWYKADKANQLLYKKAANDLENIKEIGPFNVGGRTRSILIDYNNPNRYICAGVSGGIWVSENRGESWGIVDDYAPTLSATCLTQSPFNPSLFYYGTGESYGNSADLGGLGIFKSEDGAKSFEHLEHTMTSDFDQGIWDIEHSLVLDSTIYVATHTRGLWRSTDAGQNFTRIYSTSTQVNEIEVRDDSTILIAMSGAGVVEIHERTLVAKRLNGGEWPLSGYTRVSFDYCRDFPKVMYAQLGGADRFSLYGIYKTSNGGETWTRLPDPPGNVSYAQAWYCFKISTAPADSNFITSLCVDPIYSRNGGSSWLAMADPHADYHEVSWIDDNEFLIGNDAGVSRFNKNNMTRYEDLNNGLNITQFYAGHYYPTGETIIGGTQDNGTRFSNQANETFTRINGGDGAFCAVNQQNEGIRYVSSQYLNITRQSNTGNRYISRDIRDAVGGNDGVWFINPFEINNLDGDQIYVPTKRATYRSLDGGDSWTEFTADLLGDTYAIGLSDSTNPIAYIGGTASRLYRVKNAGLEQPDAEESMWTLEYPSFLGSTIGCIEVDPNSDSTIYCGLVNVNIRPRIWRIRNASSSNPIWDDISANLPESLPVNWIEVDPEMSEHILIGTDYGLYTSLNAGASWQKETRIPNVPIDQIRLRSSDRKLFIYTHGRGIWTADLTNDPVASIQNHHLPKVRIYPNPADNHVRIESEFDLVNVYSLTGEKMGTFYQNDISTSSLQNGTYFFEVVNRSQISTRKVIIAHP